jgi:hypothetical protein
MMFRSHFCFALGIIGLLFPVVSSAHVFLGPKFISLNTSGPQAQLQLGNTYSRAKAPEHLFFTLADEGFRQLPFTHVRVSITDVNGMAHYATAPLQTIGGLCAHTLALVPFQFPREGTYHVVATYMQEAEALAQAVFSVPIGSAMQPNLRTDVRGASSQKYTNTIPPAPVIEVPEQFKVKASAMSRSSWRSSVAMVPVPSKSPRVSLAGPIFVIVLGVLLAWIRGQFQHKKLRLRTKK